MSAGGCVPGGKNFLLSAVTIVARRGVRMERSMTDSDEFPDDESELIDLTRTFDRAYWSKRLRTTEAELKEAVRAVGPKVAEVKRYLSTRSGGL
jgi:hypothetical protein